RERVRSAIFGAFDGIRLYRGLPDDLGFDYVEQHPPNEPRHEYKHMDVALDPFGEPVAAMLIERAPSGPNPGSGLACVYRAADRDGDGLPDHLEAQYRGDPDQADTDGDGRLDGAQAIDGEFANGDGPIEEPAPDPDAGVEPIDAEVVPQDAEMPVDAEMWVDASEEPFEAGIDPIDSEVEPGDAGPGIDGAVVQDGALVDAELIDAAGEDAAGAVDMAPVPVIDEGVAPDARPRPDAAVASDGSVAADGASSGGGGGGGDDGCTTTPGTPAPTGWPLLLLAVGVCLPRRRAR
ncbi:MAG: hypothetical protein KC620_24615, partial [Myxococcales bacterium]|nr:hypothetical protein [Myxococcales bacterium]